MSEPETITTCIKFAKAHQKTFCYWEYGDLVTEAWLAIQRLRDTWKPGGAPLSNYIAMFLKNRVIDSYRKQFRYRASEFVGEQLHTVSSDKHRLDHDEVLSCLDPAEKEVVFLLIRGFTRKQIAKHFGFRSPQSAQNLVQVIRRKLREKVNE
tara:strand:- start:84 stop:539 length:456 start_codon:yes stop_codon:yes gene_type:complete